MKFLLLFILSTSIYAHEYGHGTLSERLIRFEKQRDYMLENGRTNVETYADEVRKDCEVVGNSLKACEAEYWLRKCFSESIEPESEECQEIKFIVKVPKKVKRKSRYDKRYHIRRSSKRNEGYRTIYKTKKAVGHIYRALMQ